MFFGATRAAFLEFLRNLSPQIMLLTIALVLSARLDVTRFVWTLDGVKNGLPFAATLAVFFGALMANITLFLEKAATSSRAMRRVAVLARKRHKESPWLLMRALFWAGFRYNRAGLVQGVMAVLFAEIGLTVMFVAAVPAAASALHALYSK